MFTDIIKMSQMPWKMGSHVLGRKKKAKVLAKEDTKNNNNKKKRDTTGGMRNAVWRVFARLKMPLYSENANEQANAKKKWCFSLHRARYVF